MLAVIAIREMVPGGKEGTVKFKDNSNKTWNCNKEELVNNFAAGERYFIDYNESQFQGSSGPVTMKWVNRARFWREDDGANTWPDKEPYRGGTSGGGKVKKDDYDPEVGKRQTAANCAMTWCKENYTTADELALMFPTIADIVFKYVNDKGSPAAVAGGGSSESVGSDGDTEEFGF